VDSKRRETLVKPLIDGRIQHTASRRESTIASPPEDRSGGDGGGRESELLGFTAEELWRSSSQSMDEEGGEGTDPVRVGPVEEEGEHLVAKESKRLRWGPVVRDPHERDKVEHSCDTIASVDDLII
jgi:hypothetical protein